MPNSAVGALGYAAMAALALWSGDKRPSERPLPPLALAAIATASVGASAFLTYEQAVKVRAWCFWCLSSAAVNTVIWPMALSEVAEAWSAVQEGAAPDG